MSENQLSNDEQLKKQQEFLDRAYKGILKHLNDSGGKLKMGILHEYSLNKYFIQHERFSKMLEMFVDKGYVLFDWETQEVTISDAGRNYFSQ